MSTAKIIKVSAACSVFDGTEYPYWKNKMRMHLEAIDVDLWYVVENGVPKAREGVTPTDVKKFIQLDSTAKNIIYGHLTKGQYGRVSALETSKLVWDWLSKVNEGVSTHRDQRISVLRNLFNRFKRNDNKNVQLTLDASLISQMSFAHSAPLRSPSTKSSRSFCDHLTAHSTPWP